MKQDIAEKIKAGNARMSESLEKLWRESDELKEVIEKYRVSEDRMKSVAGGTAGKPAQLFTEGDKVRLRKNPDEPGIGEVTEVVDVGESYIVIAFFPEVNKTFSGYQGAFIKA